MNIIKKLFNFFKGYKMPSDKKLRVNQLLYKFLKKSVSPDALGNKLGDSFLTSLIVNRNNSLATNKALLNDIITRSKVGETKKEEARLLLAEIINDNDLVSLRFSLTIIATKDVILTKSNLPIESKISTGAHPLSIEYDNIGHEMVFYRRAYGALLSLSCFQNMAKSIESCPLQSVENYIWKILCSDFKALQKQGVEVNQMFSMLLTEVMQQSGKSKSGQEYEDRIRDILIKEKSSISFRKGKDSKNSDLEYDLLFNHKSRNYGIGAKRTLRERYKQFQPKKNMDADILITITIGLDLNEAKSKTITKNGSYIFVADEVYEENDYMNKNPKIFKGSDFNLKTLESLK